MVDKKKAFVKNKYQENRIKKFYAICRSIGIDGASQARSYKKQMDVEHINDLNDEQWEFIFEDLSSLIEDKSKNEGTIFTRDLDATLAEILGD